MSRDKEISLITRFGQLMQQKLDERSHKGRLGWRHKGIEEMLGWLKEEAEELLIEIETNPEEAQRECADVANIAMFIWDKLNTKVKGKGHSEAGVLEMKLVKQDKARR